MMTMNAGQPAPPPPPSYFDDDEMLDDYIDDDDFGGPPPPVTENATKPSIPHNNNNEFEFDDEDYWEDMMEIEGQRHQQQESAKTTNTTVANNDTAVPTTTTTTADTSFEEKEKENENDNETSNINNNNNTVEEYLAARRQDNNLYNFERYKRNKDWRMKTTFSSSSTNPQQQQSRRRQRLLAPSLLSKNSTTGNNNFAKTVAPAARFLRLLEANRNNTNNTGGKTHKLRLDQRSRSSNGDNNNINIFRSPPKEGNIPTVPMTLADGCRVYVRCCPVRNRNKIIDQGSNNSNSTTRTVMTTTTLLGANKTSNNTNKSEQQSVKSCVLGVSMKELLHRVDGMRRRKIAAARRRVDRAATTNTNRARASNNRDDMLWVDKHAPQSFPHLLSDERTNREVLRALRGWDPYVFRKAPPLRPLYQRQREQEKRDEQNNNTNGHVNKIETDKNKDNNNHTVVGANSSDKRPEENARVILLSGPPGVGKTTLAHIVARHAGYRPVEVNASDERSSGVLKDRIQRAMESTTINFKPDSNSSDKDTNNTPVKKNVSDPKNNKDDYGKPNCLILDEIDGADARGSIQALVDIVKAEISSKNNKKKQTTTNSTYLRRPIICICNHKYAPTLRPLLPYAVHFNVEPPSSARLVARLKAILNEEKMSMMGGGPLLHQLVVSSGGDIRSCLFTLQFAAAESKDVKDLSEALTHSLSGTGLKDNRNDIASTISAVFRKTKPGTAQFTTRLSSSSSRDRDRASVSRVMNAVDGLGDDSATVNALFMNVLRVSYIDPAFDRCSAAHELLSFAAGAHHQQSVSVVTAGIHLLCRVEVKPNLTFFSRELADMKYRRDSNMGLVQKFCEGLPAKAKNLKCNSLLAEELIPMVAWVLSAGDGAASLSRAASSIDILTSKEQDAAKKHVEALCGLGVTYTVDREQEKQRAGSSYQAGLSEMHMEPPIHRLVEYTSLCHPGGLCRKEIPPKMKELLAHQVLLESFRRRDAPPSESSVKKEKFSDIASKTPIINQSKSARNAESLPSPAQVTPRKLDQLAKTKNLPIAKDTNATPSPTAGNFLGIAAKKGKAAKSARRAAALGLNRLASKKQKLAHSGSGFLLSHVVRMKYVKGFTQAVRTPCRLNDLE